MCKRLGRKEEREGRKEGERLDRNNLNYSTVLRNIGQADGKLLSYCHMLEESCIPQEWANISTPQSLAGANALVDPEGQHLGLAVSYSPCSRKSEW